MKRLNFLLMILFVGLSSFGLQAQVTGKVTDPNGEPLIGASVQIKETDAGVITDLDGKFSVDAKAGDVLIFSYTGFSRQEVTVGSETSLNVVLQEGVGLDAITVVGTRGKPRTAYDAPVPIDNISAKTLET
ncbi:MAG: carboxypeptidase-like regulatory domain-containing protein, partial [Bacteroidota bacterium]